MSKQTNTLTRRSFLKGAAYTSALSVGSLSGLAMANPGTSASKQATEQTVGAQSGELFAVTLANQSDKAVALNPKQPVSLEKVNDWIVVKLNKAKPGSEVTAGQQMTLAAGQQCSFPVDAEIAPMLNAGGAYIVVTNEFSPLDNLVPITHAKAA